MEPAPLETLEALPPGSILAVGTFDGVHLGHRALLQAMAAFAAATDRPARVLTFAGSPLALLDPAHQPGLLMDREAILRQLRPCVPAARVIVQPFTPAFAALSAAAFAERLRGATIFCGEDWRFGAGAEGTPDFLRARGFDVHVVPYAHWQGERISSTRIRAALAQGRLDAAAAMLGRPWGFTGRVVHGKGLAGPTFGVPTANVPYIGRNGETMAPLARGVYRAEAILHEITWPALVNFGVAPSVKGEPAPLFEVHLLGIDFDLYDANLTLSIDTPLIRPERKFPTLDALRAQIHADLEACQ